MQTKNVRRIGLQLLLASSVCGATYSATGCLSAAATNFNPCGTVLNCDPAEFDLLTIDPTQPNYDFNPTCAIPGLFNCSTPITGVPGAASAATSSTSNTNTNTGNRGGTNTGNRGGNNTGNLFGGFGT